MHMRRRDVSSVTVSAALQAVVIVVLPHLTLLKTAMANVIAMSTLELAMRPAMGVVLVLVLMLLLLLAAMVPDLRFLMLVADTGGIVAIQSDHNPF